MSRRASAKAARFVVSNVPEREIQGLRKLTSAKVKVDEGVHLMSKSSTLSILLCTHSLPQPETLRGSKALAKTVANTRSRCSVVLAEARCVSRIAGLTTSSRTANRSSAERGRRMEVRTIQPIVEVSTKGERVKFGRVGARSLSKISSN